MKKEIFVVTILYTLLSLLFFYQLFYPEPQIFTTPDFGRSDIWHFNYPIKHFLSESLKRGELPLWSKNMGMGFPILGQGLVGTFHPLNLVLYRLFPAYLAFNLSYVFVFIFAALGTFLFFRQLKLKTYSSLIAGMLFSFSGYNIAQINHPDLLLSLSHLPWIFLIVQKLIQGKKLVFSFILGIGLALQFFTGFPQMVFVTILTTGSYLVIYSLANFRKDFLKISIIFLFGLIIMFLISAVQLIPSIEFTQNSPRREGLDFFSVTSFPFPLKHLLSFIDPYIWGNPKFGTYPRFTSNWGIFWENTSYIGLLPLLFVIIALSLKKIRKKIIVWMLIAIESLLLILGKYSPLYFIFTIPPFAFFRVPSRFLPVLTFALVAISVFGIEKVIELIRSKFTNLNINLAKIVLFFVLFFNIWYLWKDYHPVGKVSQWLNPPSFISELDKESNIRIYTTPFVHEAWNKIFLTSGWQNPSSYLKFKEYLDANSNLIFNIPSSKAYASFLPTRYVIADNLLANYYLEGADISIGTVSANLMNLFSITHIISGEKLNDNSLKLISQQKLDNETVYLYKNTKTLPRIRFVNKVISLDDWNKMISILEDEEAELDNIIFLENSADNEGPKPEYSLNVLKETNSELQLAIKTDASGYLTVADSYYPGWYATVDGNKSSVIPANLNQRAVFLEKGDHQVFFFYQPQSLITGLKLSISTLLVSIVYLVVYFLSSKKNSTLGISSPSPRRENNP